MPSQTFTCIMWHDSDPWSQSHYSLVMPIFVTITEHQVLNKVRPACYGVVQMATDIKGPRWACGRSSKVLDQSEGKAGSMEAIGMTEGGAELISIRSEKTAAHPVREILGISGS